MGHCQSISLQLDAIRTIIGTVRGTSHAKLYLESGYITLEERRKRHKIIMMHKIIHGNCPKYLSDLCPNLVSDINPYHRRRPLERYVQKSNSELHAKSFFPSSTKLYNDLPDNVKENSSISALKHYLSQNDKIVPSFYYFGKRNTEIIHTRLRLGMSDLNFDLFNRHLLQNSICNCGTTAETAEHFLLYCDRFTMQRNRTIDILPYDQRQINILLSGNNELSIEQNKQIFKIVHDFIDISGRF